MLNAAGQHCAIRKKVVALFTHEDHMIAGSRKLFSRSCSWVNLRSWQERHARWSLAGIQEVLRIWIRVVKSVEESKHSQGKKKKKKEIPAGKQNELYGPKIGASSFLSRNIVELGWPAQQTACPLLFFKPCPMLFVWAAILKGRGPWHTHTHTEAAKLSGSSSWTLSISLAYTSPRSFFGAVAKKYEEEIDSTWSADAVPTQSAPNLPSIPTGVDTFQSKRIRHSMNQNIVSDALALYYFRPLPTTCHRDDSVHEACRW